MAKNGTSLTDYNSNLLLRKNPFIISFLTFSDMCSFFITHTNDCLLQLRLSSIKYFEISSIIKLIISRCWQGALLCILFSVTHTNTSHTSKQEDSSWLIRSLITGVWNFSHFFKYMLSNLKVCVHLNDGCLSCTSLCVRNISQQEKCKEK